MNVADLKDLLDDYGDHLEVCILTPGGDLRAIAVVGSENRPEAVYVTLEDAGHGPR